MMHKFYSSLVFSNKLFPNVHQVLQPRYNKEYYKRLSVRIEELKSLLEDRNQVYKYNIVELTEDVKAIHKLKELIEKLEKRKTKSNESEVTKIRGRLDELEERTCQSILWLPNKISKSVPEQPYIMDETKSDFASKACLTKVLHHTKLSYINSCYSKSVVGPNSHYYYGIGSKVQQGLSDYFMQELENADYIPVSGLCLVKSAVVEAANHPEHKNFDKDPCRVLDESRAFTTQHITETSREAMLAFVTSLKHNSTNAPLKLVSTGSAYDCGESWFDGDDNRVSQFETVHLFTLNSSIEHYSILEFIKTRDLIWQLYKKLEIPARLMHCSKANLRQNEYDAYQYELWMPSQHRWIKCGRVSHYHDYITIRTGLKRGHIIDAITYDGRIAVAAIIENNQTANGRFVIPSVIASYIQNLSRNEAELYTSKLDSHDHLSSGLSQMLFTNMINHQQRRHLVRKRQFLYHSKARERFDWKGRTRNNLIMFSTILTLSFLVDWEEFYIAYTPTYMKRFIYDHIYRHARRVAWYFIYPSGVEKPADLYYDDVDRSEYELNLRERRILRQLVQIPSRKPTDEGTNK